MPERTGQLGDLPGMGRREFLASASLLPALAFSRGRWAVAGAADAPRHGRLFFTSQGKTALGG